MAIFSSLVVGAMISILSGCDDNKESDYSDVHLGDSDTTENIETATREPLDIEYTQAPIEIEEFIQINEGNADDVLTVYGEQPNLKESFIQKKEKNGSIAVKPIFSEKDVDNKELIEGAEVKIQRDIH